MTLVCPNSKCPYFLNQGKAYVVRCCEDICPHCGEDMSSQGSCSCKL